MRKIAIILLAIGSMGFVSCNMDINIDEHTNRAPASVAMLTSDTATLFLTDFFPAIDGFDSVACDSAEVSLSNELISVVANDAPVLGVIELNRGRARTALVYQRNKNAENADNLKLYTISNKDNCVVVGATKAPDKVIVLWQNTLLPERFIERKGDKTIITIPSGLPSKGRSYLRVYASKGDGLFSDVLLPLTDGRVVNSVAEISRHDTHAQIMYSLMIDRFNNGNPANDRKINSPDVLPIVDYLGGDLKGITKKIKEGFFTNLGISTIWISPITQNPYNAWGLNENPRTKFSGYHGYWPIYTTVVDKRFGTEEELRELLDEAHKRNLNVILDYVANHLHIDSPVLKANPDWTTPAILPDGRDNISLWDEQRLTTWFDKHIPTLDLEREAICDPMTDSALHWIANFDFDGFRHDATKHIPEGYWRMLTRKMKERFPEKKLYQIGETYGSPQLIGQYVKSGMLDAQFDFNVYDRATWSIAGANGSFVDLARELQNSHSAYGAHNTMGYITGNHDRPRFISLAGGSLSWDEDSKAAGWLREITVGDDSSYDKLLLLEAFMLTIPGVPCIYQGDEYGIPGGNDPDNRHLMQFDGYSKREMATRNSVAALAKLRKGSLPLIYGDYLPLVVEKDMLVFARVYMGDVAIVALNKSGESRTVDFALPSGLSTPVSARFAKGTIENSGHGLRVTVPALSFEIFNNQ